MTATFVPAAAAAAAVESSWTFFNYHWRICARSDRFCRFFQSLLLLMLISTATATLIVLDAFSGGLTVE